MQLETLDWCIIIGYFVLTLGIGLAFSRRAGTNMTEYFASATGGWRSCACPARTTAPHPGSTCRSIPRSRAAATSAPGQRPHETQNHHLQTARLEEHLQGLAHARVTHGRSASQTSRHSASSATRSNAPGIEGSAGSEAATQRAARRRSSSPVYQNSSA